MDNIEEIEEKIIEFKSGLPGFEEYKKFVIILNEDEENPFHKLQSLEETEISFIIINPFIFKQDYDFKLLEDTVEKLEIKDSKDVVVYTIVTIPEDYTKMTANLLGPIIINTKNNQAKQIVLNDTEYTTKHYILEESRV